MIRPLMAGDQHLWVSDLDTSRILKYDGRVQKFQPKPNADPAKVMMPPLG